MAVIAAAMTLGPTIYTCFHCSGDLAVLLLAVGQLTPWSFKMLNDGARGSQTANAPIKTPSHSKSSSTNVNTSYYPGSECGDNSDAGNAEKAIKGPTDADKSRDKFYTLLGGFVTILLAGCGWTGLVFLTMKMTYTLNWIWIIYAVGLVLSPLLIFIICKSHEKHSVWFTSANEYAHLNNFCSMFLMIMLFVLATFHIVGAHILLAKLTGNWSGIARDGAGLASSITFFIGKRLLFFDT